MTNFTVVYLVVIVVMPLIGCEAEGHLAVIETSNLS